MGQIYLAECTVNGKQYIGQTRYTMQKRRWEHECDARHGCNKPFHRAIRKHGPGAFQWSVILEDVADADLDAKEDEWISFLDTLTENGGGYNCRGAGPGGRLSEECKAKLSSSQRKAARRRRVNGYQYKSVPKSAATRAKIAQSLTGAKHSAQTKEKMFKGRVANLTLTQQRFHEGKLKMGVVYLCEDGRHRKIRKAGSRGLVFEPC